jgi:prepilin-type N-terminal cleavage/methylation domain-containing protein
MRRKGFSMIEVMMALVILGVVTTIFFQTSQYSTRNQGKTRSWEGEAAVVEKTIEGLRVGYSMTQLQSISSSWVDSSQGGQKYSVSVAGSLPSTTIANTFPQNMLAQVVVVVKKVGDTDSLVVSNVMWVN